MPSERHQLKTESAHVHQLLCSLCKVRLLIMTIMMMMTTIMIMRMIFMMPMYISYFVLFARSESWLWLWWWWLLSLWWHRLWYCLGWWGRSCNIYFQILPQCLLPKQKNGPKWHKQSCGAVKNERDEQVQGGGGEERKDSMNPNGFQSDKGWTGKQAKRISTCQTFFLETGRDPIAMTENTQKCLCLFFSSALL